MSVISMKQLMEADVYKRQTIDSDFSQNLKNVLNEEFNPTHPDAVWCSDVSKRQV